MIHTEWGVDCKALDVREQENIRSKQCAKGLDVQNI